MFSSERLIFRRLQESDLEDAIQMNTDEATMKYILGKALSIEEATSRFHSQLEMTMRHADLGFFVAQNKANHSYIGHVKFVQYSEVEYEVGYVLKKEYWGKGYASEMLAWLKLYAQQITTKPPQLIGIVEPENTASVHVLEKGGFVFKRSASVRGKLVSIFQFDF